MNNATNLAIAAILMAATLIVGATFSVTTAQSAFAYQKKKVGGTQDGGSKTGNTVTIEECKNKGSASGFDTTRNQECENLICTHPGENATCVQEGAVTTTTTPVKLTCEECIRKFLNADQIFLLTRETNDLAFFCQQITGTTSEEDVRFNLVQIAGVSESVADQVIQCLIDAGVQFSTDTGPIIR
jgi:hypothetical protein